MPSETVKIKWDYTTDEDLSVVYDKHNVKTAHDIKSILKFERIAIQTMTKIVIAYVSKLLKSVVEMPGDVNKNCNDLIVTTLDEYTKRFKQRGQLPL